MNLLLAYALNALWQVPLLTGAGRFISRLCRQAHPRGLHLVSVVTLLLAVLVPALGISRGVILATAHAGSAAARVLAGNADSMPQRKLFEHGTLVLSRSWDMGLTCVYLLLILAAAARLLIGVVKTQTLVRVSTKAELTRAQQRVWQRCRQVFGIRSAGLQTSGVLRGPAVIGWQPPVLLLPSSFLTETADDELLAALSHECAHIARRDYLLNLLYECLALPIAWHPLTRILKAQIAQTREVACDQMVAELVMKPTLYAGALLRLASRIPAPLQEPSIHAVGIFDANILEKRVMNLKTKRIALSSMKKSALAAAAIAVAATCTVSAVALTMEVDQAQTSAAAQPAHSHVYKVGGDISAPTLIHSVDPKFPSPKEQPSGFNGIVVVKMVVDRKGLPGEVEIVHSLAPRFDAAAIAAVRKYRFSPALRSGQPVDVSVNVEVNFKKY